VRTESSLLREVPDLVEYPAVVAGTFSLEFLELPEEVLTTTLIHHQHYFPIESEDGRLKNAFLAVINTEPENERTIASNAERVVTARLRDARFFWAADRRVSLESRLDRLATLLFHKKLGSYREKAERIERLARTIASQHFGASEDVAKHAARAARLSKADLATDMVREFTELQGKMGGIYAREEGLPEEVWKAIYYHYLPLGVEADGPPSRAQLGKAAATWAAVSLADKLDTVVGLFAADEKPTGSRDPYGLRRAAHGILRVLVDLKSLTGLTVRPTLFDVLSPAMETSPIDTQQLGRLSEFLLERLAYLLEERGFDVRNVRAVTFKRGLDQVRPADELSKLSVLPEFTGTDEFLALAKAFKRVRNIGKARDFGSDELNFTVEPRLQLPAELELFAEIQQREATISAFIDRGAFREAFSEAAKFGPAVDRFFNDVLVMAEDETLKAARLRLLKRLEKLILRLADISEIVSEDKAEAHSLKSKAESLAR
jgi:glycyl-tRNA synthetase beta chain